MRLFRGWGLMAATLGLWLGGCSSGSGLDGGPGKTQVEAGGGASASGGTTSVAVTGGTTSVAVTGGTTSVFSSGGPPAAGSTGVLTGSRGGDSVTTGGKGGGGIGGTGAGGVVASSTGGAGMGGSVTGTSLPVDAGAGPVDADSKPKDFTRLIGKYKVAALGGGLMCGTAGSAIQFKDEAMTVERGSDANLVATTNPMPGEYPAACALKINAVDSPESGMLMAVQNSSCSSGGVTLTLSAYVFANGQGDPKVVISANGMLTGGPHGDCNFSYSAEAIPAP